LKRHSRLHGKLLPRKDPAFVQTKIPCIFDKFRKTLQDILRDDSWYRRTPCHDVVVECGPDGRNLIIRSLCPSPETARKFERRARAYASILES